MAKVKARQVLNLLLALPAIVSAGKVAVAAVKGALRKGGAG